MHLEKEEFINNMLYEEFIKEAMNLEEASTSRIHSRLNDRNSICAIISPYPQTIGGHRVRSMQGELVRFRNYPNERC